MSIVPPTPKNIASAAELLAKGELVAFPTETVYGLGGNAKLDSAIKKIYSAKNRPIDNPLIVHIENLSQIGEVADLKASSNRTIIELWLEKLAEFCPGPLTIVLPRARTISNLIGNTNSVAVRIPDHPVAQALLAACKFPLAAPSANPSGYISPTTAQHVADQLSEKVGLILDGGDCEIGIESTVVSLLETAPVLLRPGAVTKDQLEDALQILVIEAPSKKNVQLSPGMLLKHYSPKTPTILRSTIKDWSQVPRPFGYIAFSTQDNSVADVVVTLSKKGDLREIAHKLFAALRELDNGQLAAIVVDECIEDGIGVAIMDRLRRAVE